MVLTYAVGDIHGSLGKLTRLIAACRQHADGREMTLVFLGDYIDRGPDSKGCIDRILRFRAVSPATVVALLGNHEDGLMRTPEDTHGYSWLTVMEGFATVRSYSAAVAEVLVRAVEAAGPRLVLERIALPYDAFLDAIPSEHLTFLRTARAVLARLIGNRRRVPRAISVVLLYHARVRRGQTSGRVT